MLKENLSIDAIAKNRQLSVGTIISHIEKLKSTHEIDHTGLSYLKDKLPKKDFDIIFSELKKSEDGKLQPIYDKLEGKYSYANIQLVRLFINESIE